MKLKLLLPVLLLSAGSLAQNGWSVCNAPDFNSRVDDIFMVNDRVGFAVCGDGQVVKTTDRGDHWATIVNDTNVYCRSVKFFNEQVGFVGSFVHSPSSSYTNNILRRTTDGGDTWTDITSSIDPRARKGICGLAIADNSTIYGCGNWYGDSAYIIKSTDGGYSWSFINMHPYASSIIDMHFINRNVGFAAGKDTSDKAIILYTTNGGITWAYKFSNTNTNDKGYCWKIQRLNDQVYFASVESMNQYPPKILRSDDGGMNWISHQVDPASYYLEGVGFLNSMKGWAGGEGYSFETNDGGITWNKVNICPFMNRVFRVNDTLLFATGDKIWKYRKAGTTVIPPVTDSIPYTSIQCYPNPANENLNIDINLSRATHVLLLVMDETGRRVKVIVNKVKERGIYKYSFNTGNLAPGIYYIVFKTHEEKHVEKILVTH